MVNTLYALAILLSVLGFGAATSGSTSTSTSSVSDLSLFLGIFLFVLAFIIDNNKQKGERAQFLMMSREDAEIYINNTKNPQLRIKLVKDWQNHHISTKL